jgi:hypothetical protein
MSTSSEAVMVSPEQCATAPKTVVKPSSLETAKQASPTRMVLLAVLALAAATGAMFGVVVFGNEFTKDVHPKGDTHANSVTLVDVNDRAIATADVESYVSLLDLPLLGTAELNKVDGITYSTLHGIEHRKITGYVVSKESAVVGGVSVETPHLSLRCGPGVTIDVSVRDSSAVVMETDGEFTAKTSIQTSSTRRLTGAGSCLSNGACLYSQDEILALDAENRRLEEGSFFARADVAAYQVDLQGEDVMQYLGSPVKEYTYINGKYSDGGHVIQLKVEMGPTTQLLLQNMSSGKFKLINKNGTFVYDGNMGVSCTAPDEKLGKTLGSVTWESLRSSLDFTETSSVVTERDPAFSPYTTSATSCAEQVVRQGNLTSPASEARFGTTYRNTAGNKPRKLAAKHFESPWATRIRLNEAEKAELMKSKRELAAVKVTTTMHPDTYITHFDLWVATRMADPTFVFDYSVVNGNAVADSYLDPLSGSAIPNSMVMDLSGSGGVSMTFIQWTGYSYYDEKYYADAVWSLSVEGGFDDDGNDDARTDDRGGKRRLGKEERELSGSGSGSGYAYGYFYDTETISDGELDAENQAVFSSAFWQTLLPGTCTGGYSFNGGTTPPFQIVSSLCGSVTYQGIYDSMYSANSQASTDLIEWVSTAIFDYCDAVLEPAMRRSMQEKERGLAAAEMNALDVQVSIGNAWASMLIKTTNGQDEAVAVFQGTKAGDSTMFQYNLDQKPAYITLGSLKAVVPHGIYRYMNTLLPCMYAYLDVMPIGGFSSGSSYTIDEPAFITGHSLGGAAATLFTQTKTAFMDPSTRTVADTYPRLVTFGSAPTSYIGIGPSTDHPDVEILCVDPASPGCVSTGDKKFNPVTGKVDDKYILSITGWSDYLGLGLQDVCGKAPPQSVRFFHKFDPVPSIGMWGGSFQHAIVNPIMVWETPSSDCSLQDFDASCKINADDSKTYMGADVDGIVSYLCDAHGMETNMLPLSCYDYVSSYFSILNPWPCGQIAYTAFMQLLQDSTYAWLTGHSEDSAEVAGFETYKQNIFTAYEGMFSCSFAWWMTVDAYWGQAYLDHMEGNGILFTFTWVHSTYPNYPLCLSVDSSGELESFGDYDDSDFELQTEGVDSSEMSTCYNAVDYSDPDYYTKLNYCICAAGTTSDYECELLWYGESSGSGSGGWWW